MNEEEFLAESASLGEDTAVEENQPVVEEQQEETGQDLDLSPIEQEAFDQGWRPIEQFNGQEDHWKTAKEYVNDGKWLAKLKESNQRIDHIEKQFNERLENANKLAEAKRTQDIADLKEQQHKAAFEDGDEDAYKSAQKKIEALESETPASDTTPKKAQAIVDWENANEWVNDADDERSGVAIALYDTFARKNPNGTIEQALEHVDSKISVLYPTKNPRREQPNATESPKRQPGRKGRDLSMSDLTREEQGQWSSFGQSMFTEKEFLKAVKDARVK